MPQLSYSYSQPIAFEGMGVDTTHKQDLSFFSAESGISEIAFGRMVCQGSGDFTCNNLSTSTDKLIGIAMHSHSYEPGIQLGAGGGVLPKEPVTVRQKGRCWVLVESTVTPASVVYVRYTVNTAPNNLLGRFSATSDSSKNRILYGANFVTSAAAGGLAQLEFDLSIHAAKIAS